MMHFSISCLHIFACLIPCFYLGYTLTPVKDPIDFTVVDDSSVNQVKKSSDGLPLNVDVNFNVLGRPVQLKLKRNPKLRSVNGIYSIKRSESGIPVILHERLERYEVFGEYQDPNNRAIFTLSCPQTEKNQSCDAIMEGTFRAGKKEFRMKLMDDKGLHRGKRAVSRLWNKAKTVVLGADEKSKIYGIYETESSPATPTDYKDAGPMLSGKVAAAFGRTAKIVRDDILPGGREYNLEILALIDYGIYQRFYKASKKRSEKERDNEVKLNIQRYFSHVFNGVDLMYKGIDDTSFGLSVALSGLIIADSPDTSPWSTPLVNPVRDGRDELLVNEALDALIRWSFTARNVPENDHIMLITDYDLYSLDSGTKDRRTAGYARVASVCSLDSVSIIEDHGGFQSINAAAHELGHSLGARHDGKSNSCDAKDQYIMTAHGGFESEKTKTNPWRFSKCSVEYFKTYIRNLGRRNCLRDPADIYDERQFTSFLSNYPGQMFTPNEQCQDILGLESYYGWGRELGSFSDVCTAMSCSMPGSGRSFRIYKAARGTSCGDKRWCQNGRCVFDERAPPRNPSCVFGDMQKRFGNNKSCRQYMLERPLRCYDKFYKSRCCETCEKLDTGVPGCEYGDKFLNCRASGCYNEQYRRDCCSTCGLAPPPVLRTTPPTTPAPITRPPITRPLPRKTTRKPILVTRRTRPTTKRAPVWLPKRTTRAPPRMTDKPIPRLTTSNVITERRKSSNLQPSGKQGMCLRMNDRFLLVFPCSSLTTLFGKEACDNSLISRYCCEKCPPPTEPVCEDKPSCRIKHPRDCYVPSKRAECCRSCKIVEQNIPGCEYGDRIRSCERYLGGLGRNVVCSKYKKYCCGLCSSESPKTKDVQTIEENKVLSDATLSKDARNIPDLTNQPSTFVTRDADGNLMIVGTGRNRGSRNIKKENRKEKRKNRQENRQKKTEKRQERTNNMIGPNLSRDVRIRGIPNQTIMIAARPVQRRNGSDQPRNFRIVFSGKRR